MSTFTRIRFVSKLLFLISVVFVCIAIINLPDILYPSFFWVLISLGIFLPTGFALVLIMIVKDAEEAINRLKE